MVATMHSYTLTVDEATIHAAMVDVALALVDEIRPGFDVDNALAAVARTPVSMAATMGDICAMLGVAPPAFVRTALS